MTSLYLDGEGVYSNKFLEVIEDVNYFEELCIMFGEYLDDPFILELSKKARSEHLRSLVMRKATEVTNQAFEIFFAK